MIKTFQDFTNNKVTKGIQMTFANGNTISIMFGVGNYCANKKEAKDSCIDAEIAIWNGNGHSHQFSTGEVKGWCNTNEIATWIDFAANSEIKKIA